MTGFARPPALLSASPSASRRVYDVLVVGPDVGGAAVAVAVSRRGLRVLLVPVSPPSAAREKEGWLLPASHPMLPALRQLSAASAALDDLGLGQEVHRLTAQTSGAFQVLGRKMRLSLPVDEARRHRELLRELGVDGAAEAEAAFAGLEALGRPWDAFLAEPPPYPARGFFERRRLRRHLPAPPALPQGFIGRLLESVAPFAAQAIGPAAPEATARLGAALLRAPLRLWGGAAQLAELLREKALSGGVELTTDPPLALQLERKGVVLQIGPAEIRASTLVLACDGALVAALCEKGGRAERRLAAEARLEVAQKVALCHFVVRSEGLPLALEEAALLLDQPGGPLVLANLPARHPKAEAEGERLLTVARTVDAHETDGGPLLDQVQAALEPVLPFFERHILLRHADLDPPLPHPIFRPSPDGKPIGLRPLSAAHSRVLFASAGVYPGFGLEGQLLAARACTQVALAQSGRKQVAAT